MPLILGIVASGNYPRVTNSYESIATTTVGAGGSSSISFSSIPSTYKHLQIRGIGRAAAANNTRIQFNGDTASNYRSHFLYGDGASAGAGDYYAYTANYLGNSTSTANVVSAFVIDILDYTSTAKNKTTRTLMGCDTNGAGVVQLMSGLWLNSSTAISSINLFVDSSTFAQYSSFALYGIKG